MSKLSFRARAVDANKPMPVYIGDGVPPDYEFTSVSRAVLEMPTGMEKDEESEHHLQRALTAQQAYGTAEALAIPVPDMDNVGERFIKLYGTRGEFKVAKQYIHVQLLGLDAEVPDYDMDSEDEQWLNKQVKHLKMEITPLKFENMIDRLQKGSGQTVVSLNEAKALLKEDDELTIAVYDYWLNKRLKMQASSLIPQVKTERRDGCANNNPYVAFRRRTEKMQTRKNRKNDEVSYEKMMKLRRDLRKSLIIMEIVKRREKAKKEQGKLTVEIFEKRCPMQDWDGALLAEAESKKDSMPRFLPIPAIAPINMKEWSSSSLSHNDQPKAAQKKREYRKAKHHKHPHLYPSPQSSIPPAVGRRAALAPSSINCPMPNHMPYPSHHFFGPPPHRTSHQNSYEDDLTLSGSSTSDREDDSNPDGAYAFKRRAGCLYVAPLDCKRRKLCEFGESIRDPFADLLQTGNSIHAFHLASLLKRPDRSRCLGYVRQRTGRGGRIVLDRRASEWDGGLRRLDMFQVDDRDPLSSEYAAYVRSNNIVHFRQSSQSMFCPSRHHDPPGTSQNAGQAFSHLAKSSLLKPILNCNFNKQVQMLVHLRQSENSADRPGGDGKPATGSTEGPPTDLPHRSSPVQNPSNAVGDQKANLVISAIRGLTVAACKKDHGAGGASDQSKVCLSTVVKSGLANGRVGLSTMPAANILQLNYPLANTQKTLSSSNSSPCLSEVVPATSEGKPVLGSEVKSTEVASNDAVAKTERPEGAANNGFPSPTISIATKNPDNGLVLSRRPVVDASKLQQLTVQNLLISSSNAAGLSWQPSKQLLATLQSLPTPLKPLQNQPCPGSISAVDSSCSNNSISNNSSPSSSSSSSASLLTQKLQKTQSIHKGAHQVLVRANAGAACSVEIPTRIPVEPAQSSDDKNKTFAMEVT